MIYSLIAVPFAVFLIFLTVIGEKKSAMKPSLAKINAVLSIIGAAVIPAVHLIARKNIMSDGFEPAWSEWAWDMFTIYYSISVPVVSVLLGILLLSSLSSFFTERRKGDTAPKLRTMTSCAASVVMLILAPAYAFMTDNNVLPVDTYILIIGFAQSLLFRSVFTLEYISESRSFVKRK